MRGAVGARIGLLLVSIGSTVEPPGKGVGERGDSILLFSWILAGEELWFVFRSRKENDDL